jgi:prevent-host-death family protein
MASVGVRELRQRASELLRRVERGEIIEVTDRGRPVAILAPPPEPGPVERLRAMGEIDDAEASLDDLPQPLSPPARAESPTRALRRLRQDER